MWWLIGVYVVLLVAGILTGSLVVLLARRKRAEEPEVVLKPGIRRRAARSGTISPEHYDELRRLGASEEFLARLRPVVREDEDRNER